MLFRHQKNILTKNKKTKPFKNSNLKLGALIAISSVVITFY
ncbi:MAG: hypothetical protein ACJAXJ_003282 [Colwellia sp.]|jgi:hypothetical protein